MVQVSEINETEYRQVKRGWVIQKRVIFALLMREILTRYGRHNIGFLWLFVEPMVFTVAVIVLWTAMHSVHGSNLPIAAFAITGYSSVLLWRNMTFRCCEALEPNKSLLHHRPVQVIDIYLSRILLEIVGATTSFVVLSVVFIFTTDKIYPPEDYIEVLCGWGILIWFGASLSILIGGVCELTTLGKKLWHPISYILFPLSGAAFQVDALPAAAQQAVLYLPMVHGVEILREGFFGSQFRAHYSVSYAICSCLVLTIFGLALNRIMARQATVE